MFVRTDIALHARTQTPVRVMNDSGLNQIRNVQRRDCRGGGEGSRGPETTCALSNSVTLATDTNGPADVRSAEICDASFLDSGKGACETTQHDALPAAIVWAGCSVMSIFSHWDRVSIVAHSPGNEEKSAHRETGLGPNSGSPRASVNVRSRFTDL